MDPDVVRRREGIQLSYTLPHRIADTCLYPRSPSNGSTIIICAHDEGLRIIWYAGKRPKQKSPPQTNGNSIDLTDEEACNTSEEYEDEEPEIDPARPFHDVLDYLDISFGTAAVKIAVPPLTPGRIDDLPRITNTHAIILAACADLSLRLVAVSLEPATGSKKDIQHVTINAATSHQDLISNVAITLTATSPEEHDTQQQGARSRSRGRESDELKPPTTSSQEWSFLLASTSPTGTGLLLVHQIPINSDGQISNNPEDHVPVQRHFMRCALARCRLEFSSSIYPSHRHCFLLVASGDGAATKIYEAASHFSSVKKRRTSTATTDSALSANLYNKRNGSGGKILIDLHAPFNRMTDHDLLPRRKRILDAKWVLHGRAIMVLLEDGEWGVWDLEASGPSATSQTSNLVRGKGNISGVQGGSVTKFAVKGIVNTGNKPKQSAGNNLKTTSEPSLAPMTPHTRKTRSDDLFKGHDQASSNEVASTPSSTSSLHGSISVAVQPSNSTSNRTSDESVILSYGSTNLLIPSLQSFWRAEGNRGSMDGPNGARPVRLPQLQTVDEERSNVLIIPQKSEQSINNTSLIGKLTQNFMVATSSKIMLFVAPLTEAVASHQASSIPMRLLAESSTNQDQMLLDSGELDVDGMDRILDGMASRGALEDAGTLLPVNDFGRKSIGFQLDDDDEDVDMTTPTAAKSARTKLNMNKDSSTREEGGRRLFT